MQRRRLGRSGLEVSAIGLGCMGMSAMYGASDEAESIATLHRAIELGMDFLDTSDMYGNGHNEELVGPGDRRPARSGPAGDEVRQHSPSGRHHGRQRSARVRGGGLRGQPPAPARRLRGPLLPAPRGPQRPHRGDGRRHGRAGQSRERPGTSASPRRRRPPSDAPTRSIRSRPCRPSTRSGRGMPKPRFCRPAGSWGSAMLPTRRSVAASWAARSTTRTRSPFPTTGAGCPGTSARTSRAI